VACITKRRGRWVIDFYDQHGKRRWKTLKEGITKKEAKKALRDIEDKVEKGDFISSKEIPSFSKVADMWLAFKKPNIRHTTYDGYKGHLENHLKEYYGETKITRINFSSVERFISHCQGKEVTIATLKKILITFGQIMTYAYRKKYINHNPIREIEKPKGQSEHNEDGGMNILLPSQIRNLLSATEDLKSKTLFMMAIFTGMREGEILGLKWKDIDWFSKQVYVKRTFNHGRFYEPKTKASRRKIDMAPQLVAQLKKWKLACLPNTLDLVFSNGKGNPINANNLVNRAFYPDHRFSQ